MAQTSCASGPSIFCSRSFSSFAALLVKVMAMMLQGAAGRTAPYALALGVDRSFARHYGRSTLPECSYLITGHRSQMNAPEWNQLLRDTVEALDERQRQLVWERLLGQ